MRENVFIGILLLVTTVAYSLILVHIYSNTKTAEDAAEYAAVSEDSISSDEAAYLIEDEPRGGGVFQKPAGKGRKEELCCKLEEAGQKRHQVQGYRCESVGGS